MFITVVCNHIVVCVDCSIFIFDESGILKYFFTDMLCVSSHIYMYTVIVVRVREIMYTKMPDYMQLHHLVAFESSTDLGWPLSQRVHISLIELDKLYYHQNINGPMANSTMNNLSLWSTQIFPSYRIWVLSRNYE